LNGVPICPTCADAVRDKAGRSFAEVNKALGLTQNKYREALAAHSEAVNWCSVEPGNPDVTEALRKANTHLEAASLAYAKAMRDYRAFTPE
jgi:hypothetical protein